MTVTSWQLRRELHWLVLEPTAQLSLLAFSFLSVAHCWSLLNSHHHLLQKEILKTGGVNKMHIWIHSYSDEGIIRQLVRMSEWSLTAILSQIPYSFDVLPSETGSQRTVFLPFKLIKTSLIYWPILEWNWKVNSSPTKMSTNFLKMERSAYCHNIETHRSLRVLSIIQDAC